MNTVTNKATPPRKTKPKGRHPDKARANHKLAREGGDPLAEKRRTQGMPSFAEAAARVVEQKQAGWRNPRQAHDWMVSLRRYAFPRIGGLPVSEVTSGVPPEDRETGRPWMHNWQAELV